jgi:8-amino-7-oxononanoate synthase
MGGGGTLKWYGIKSHRVILITSLAKGFGVPMACLSGSKPVIADFDATSSTRVYCSPPSAAMLRSAEHALELNRIQGELLRLRLAYLVRYFQQALGQAGFSSCGGLFPVRTLDPAAGMDSIKIYEQLLRQGIRTVLRKDRVNQKPLLTFLLTARHHRADLDYAVAALAGSAQAIGTPVKRLEVSNGHAFR